MSPSTCSRFISCHSAFKKISRPTRRKSFQVYFFFPLSESFARSVIHVSVSTNHVCETNSSNFPLFFCNALVSRGDTLTLVKQSEPPAAFLFVHPDISIHPNPYPIQCSVCILLLF